MVDYNIYDSVCFKCMLVWGFVYGAASLTLVREQCFIRIIYYYYYLIDLS